jgi:hypothetical protein
LNLLLDLGFDLVEFGRNGSLVVSLPLPFNLLCCGFLSFLFRDASKIFSLKGEIGGSIVSLAYILSELKYALALALVAPSCVGKAIAQRVDLLSNSANGCFVVLLVPL